MRVSIADVDLSVPELTALALKCVVSIALAAVVVAMTGGMAFLAVAIAIRLLGLLTK